MPNKIVRLDKKSILIAIVVIVGGFSSIYLFLDGQEDVTDNFYAEQIMSECDIDVNCSIDYLRDIAKREKQSTVLATFGKVVTMYESTYYCHPQVHQLGMFLYPYTGSLAQALSYADQRCGGALYHGVVHSFFKTVELPDNIDVTKICPEDAENPYALVRWQCLHGIGHGLAASYNYDVFTAIQRCEELEPGWEQLSCSKGIFMENADNYYESGVGAFDEDDLLFPCNEVDAKYAPPCYHYHATYLFYHAIDSGKSLNESFEECDKITPEEFVKYCYYGMGRHMSILAFVNMKDFVNICQNGQLDYHTYCFRGLVMTLVNNKGTDQAFEYCKLLPEQFKTDCYDGMGKWINMLHATYEGRKEECSKAENLDYFEVCMKANLDSLTLL